MMWEGYCASRGSNLSGWSAEPLARTEPIEAVWFVGGESSVRTVKPTVYVRRERAEVRDRRAAVSRGETDQWATGAAP